MLHWVWDEIFTNVETAELLKNNGIKGFEIQDVLIGNEISPITKQIKIINKLELGYIPDEKYGEIKECKTCGNKQYYTLGRQSKYSKNIFEGINVDIIKTAETMGIGGINYMLISKKFYNFIIESSLDDNLDIEPIVLVD